MDLRRRLLRALEAAVDLGVELAEPAVERLAELVEAAIDRGIALPELVRGRRLQVAQRRTDRGLARAELAGQPDEAGADGEDCEQGECECHGPTNARVRRRTAQKISPDNSEEPPGLSAGSSDSEELPDPTGGR